MGIVGTNMPMKAINEIWTEEQVEKILKRLNAEDEQLHRVIESYERLLERLKKR